MDRRTAAGIVLVLLSVVVAVQLSDPQFSERGPPEVDFSEPPNEVAADAAKQFEYVDYAYRVDTKYNGRDGWRQRRVTHVDHSNKTYRNAGPGGERGEVIYGTTTAGFVRPGLDEDWVVIGHPDVIYPVRYLTQPMHVERIRSADVYVISKNSSTMTIHVEDNPLKIEGELPGKASIVVDKDTGMIESVRVAYEPPSMETHYLKFQVIERETTVERPEAIRFSPWEVFWDLLRGPLFRIEWLL